MRLDALVGAHRGLGAYPIEARRIARAYKESGVGKTLFYNTDPIASAGLHMPWPGLAFAWAVISPVALKRPHVIMTHNSIANGLMDLAEAYNLRRIEACVDESFVVGQRWIEKLGFKYESDIPLFGPQGQDFKRYVILRKFDG